MKAEYVRQPGNELTVVNAARVSFDKESSFELGYSKEFDEFNLKAEDKGLIRYLANHGHWSPFSHVRETFKSTLGVLSVNYEELPIELRSALVFDVTRDFFYERTSVYGWIQLLKNGFVKVSQQEHLIEDLTDKYPETMEAYDLRSEGVGAFPREISNEDLDHPDFTDATLRYTVPIFISRQEFKHIVGFARNETSRRYVDDTPELFTPNEWRKRPEGSVKQGSSAEIITGSHWWDSAEYDQTIEERHEEHNQYCLEYYDDLIRLGVAPEQARMELPQSMMTSYYITGSLSAYARMVSQRSDSHAQVEIQELAAMVDDVLTAEFPESWPSIKEK